jgi:hypothetical protein
VKLGSREDMRVIVARACRHRLEQQLQTRRRAPAGRTPVLSVSHHSEMWESVMKNRNAALLGSAPEDLEVELMVVGIVNMHLSDCFDRPGGLRDLFPCAPSEH